MPRLHHTTRMRESIPIYYCGVVPINYIIGRDYMSAKALVFTSNVKTGL